MSLHQTNIFIHVFAACLGLFVGTLIYLNKKGGKKHRILGKFFLGTMGVVIITAVFGVTIFRDRPFLTVVTMQSFYMTISGYRALKYKKNGPQYIDFMLSLLMVLTMTLFIIKMASSNVIWNSGIVYYILGFSFFIVFYDVLRFFSILSGENLWLPEHILKMTNAFGALFSAGVGTVITNMEPWNQITASILSTGLLLSMIILYFKKYRLQFTPPKTNIFQSP